MAGRDFQIAGDISSAAFFMVSAAVVNQSKIVHRDVLGNSTRTGVARVLSRAGAGISTRLSDSKGPETSIDFTVVHGPLRKFEVKKEELPSLIDEIPVLCVLATQADGASVIHDADELRVKETDRINSMVSQLSKMGAAIKAAGNTLIINGPTPLKGAVVNSFKDHRTAMSLIVAGMIAGGETVVEDIECIDTSFPGFFDRLKALKVPFELQG